MRDLFSKAAAYLSNMRQRRLWMQVVSCLACVVVFCTTYALILPAITLEKSAFKPDGNLPTSSSAGEIVATDSNAKEGGKEQIATDSNAAEKSPAQKMLAAAQRFLGYEENEDDYIEEDGVRRGFSLFGEYYGRPYKKWDDMFVSYCMEEAEIEDVPNAADSDFDYENWITLLDEAGLYRTAGVYTPAPSDLVFLDLDDDGAADSVAISEKILENRLVVIAGDSSDRVRRVSYNLESKHILGYAQMAGGRVYYYGDGSVSVDVILPEGCELPEDAVLTVRPLTDSNAQIATSSDAWYEYAQMKEKAEAAVGREAVKIDFYDISFYTSEGEYIPVADTATVTIRFEKTEELTNTGEMAVVHYQEDADKPVVLEGIEKKDNEDGVTALTFQTEGFSVFGVMALADGQTEGSFTLTYTVDGTDYKITFNMVDAGGNAIPGDYTTYNRNAENGKRYIFGAKDTATVGSDAVVDQIAPTVAGYTYTGAVLVETTNNTVYSVAMNGYNNSVGGEVSGKIRFYSTEPLTEQQFLEQDYGNYTVTLTYTQNADNLNGKTFAIVNQAGGSRALTAAGTTVNDVNGLTSQAVTVLGDAGNYQVRGNVTAWTFHRLEDGTYSISTTVTGNDEQKAIKYLRLCEESYQNRNDGRGSLTLTDETNASHITVAILTDGRVTMTSSTSGTTNISSINRDSTTHNFWCYNRAEGDNSKHILCEIVESTEDYSGDWVIVNMRSGANTGVAMQAGGVNKNENANRAGLTVRVDTEGNTHTVLHEDATVWHFEKQTDGTYYISIDVTDTGGSITQKYLTIGTQNDAPITLSDNSQAITVTEGTGSYSGMIRLTNSVGMAVNLFGGDANRGFGSYNDPGINEWHTLCKKRNNYDIITTAVNHPSSVINLFDYWITTPTASDAEWDSNQKELGINKGHTLKFSKDAQGSGLEDFNLWTGKDASVFTGIVQNKLGADGYPILAKGDKESLDYLFNPKTENAYRETHRNVGGLLQTDSQGYYYYNSAENFAQYDEDTNRFILYDTWGVKTGGSSPNGQFFPFNDMDEVVDLTSRTEPINHYLGLTLTTRFVQKYGGHTTSSRSTDTVFNFAGDDDVWIFIDDVLVADLGGIHDASRVSINFSTGQVEVAVVNTKQVTYTGNLKKIFEDAGVSTEGSDWAGNTFADNTYHTLKFFYLERGNTDSNLHLQYNLTEIPLTAIYKVNQYGTPLEGAEFEVFKADKNYKLLQDNPNMEPVSVYTGVTNREGQMAFVDDDGMPYTLNELKTKFGEYFVLKETKAPEKYSVVSDEAHLHIVDRLLLCENTYDSGVWSRATLQVAAPNTLKRMDGKTIEYYDLDKEKTNGTLFAVVLKYMGTNTDSESLKKQENWAPVYGNEENGYKVMDHNIADRGEFIAQVIEAAKEEVRATARDQASEVCFTLSASGAMQLRMTHLPGDIRNYYYMLDADSKNKTQYTIAYYWTAAGSLAGADSTNTFRVNGEDKDHSFDRAFGATIEIPNLINRLFAQKLNEEGELVNGARFAMYKVEESGTGEDRKIYYKTPGGENIYLELDTDGDNSGTACVGNDSSYVYRIDSQTGNIQIGKEAGDVFTPETAYTIEPYQTGITQSGSESLNISKEDGTAVFGGIDEGKYYLREIGVPTGYQLNPTEVMILVTGDAVYANAGTENDGVTVARGPGYLVDTLDQFASLGDIDKTLSWVYERLRISGVSNTFSAYDDKAWKTWGYLKENDSGTTVSEADSALTTYLEYSPGHANTTFNFKINEGRYPGVDIKTLKRRLYTTVGWSYYELYQDAEYGKVHKGQAHYTELLDTGVTPAVPLEIAHLFSRSTYVRMTDKKARGNLEISKKVVNAPTTGNPDSYTFTVNLKDAAGNSLTGTYSYKIYNLETTTVTVEGQEKTVTERVSVKDSSDSTKDFEGQIGDDGTITLNDKQVAVITELPAGTRYTVTENVPNDADYIVTAVRDDGKAQVGEGTGEKVFGGEVTGTLYWAVQTIDGTKITDTTSTVEFTNTYPSELTIHKVSSSNHSISLSGAEFVFYKIDENNVKQYYSYTPGTSDGSGTTSGETSWNEAGDAGEAKFKLTTYADGKITLHGIWNGTYWLKELTAPAGYNLLTEPIQVVVEEGKLKSHTGAGGVTISKDGLILTVSNNPGYKLPDTGGYGTRLYTFGGTALLAGTLLYYLRKRRRKGGM